MNENNGDEYDIVVKKELMMKMKMVNTELMMHSRE